MKAEELVAVPASELERDERDDKRRKRDLKKLQRKLTKSLGETVRAELSSINAEPSSAVSTELPKDWEQLHLEKQRQLYARLIFNHFAETPIDLADPAKYGDERDSERRSGSSLESGSYRISEVRLSGRQGLGVTLMLDPAGSIAITSQRDIVDISLIRFRVQRNTFPVFRSNKKYPLTKVITNHTDFVDWLEKGIAHYLRELPNQQAAQLHATSSSLPATEKPKHFRPIEYVDRWVIWAPTGFNVEDTKYGQTEVVYTDIQLLDSHRPETYRAQRILNARLVH